jgi:hypothetical protein
VAELILHDRNDARCSYRFWTECRGHDPDPKHKPAPCCDPEDDFAEHYRVYGPEAFYCHCRHCGRLIAFYLGAGKSTIGSGLTGHWRHRG